MPKEYTKVVLHPSGRVDPTQTYLKCEGGCGKEILMSHSHSIVMISYATRIDNYGNPLPSFQCPEEQHFCCSEECMINATTTCLKEHLLPLHRSSITIEE